MANAQKQLYHSKLIAKLVLTIFIIVSIIYVVLLNFGDKSELTFANSRTLLQHNRPSKDDSSSSSSSTGWGIGIGIIFIFICFCCLIRLCSGPPHPHRHPPPHHFNGHPPPNHFHRGHHFGRFGHPPSHPHGHPHNYHYPFDRDEPVYVQGEPIISSNIDPNSAAPIDPNQEKQIINENKVGEYTVDIGEMGENGGNGENVIFNSHIASAPSNSQLAPAYYSVAVTDTENEGI